MNCIIIIEMGTAAVRVFAFDLSGNLISSSKGHYPTFHEQPDHSEQDPEQMFITMLYILKNLLNEKIYPKKYTVTCICFGSSMHSLLAVDKDGIPLGNAITWADNRGKKEAAELKQSSLGEEIYKATGTPIHPMSSLIKIAWMKNHDPEKFRLAKKFMPIKTYIIQQLTGACVIDYSIASATGLMNIHNLTWDRAALEFAGITPEELPDLHPVFYSGVTLKKEYQRVLKLSPTVKILIGSSDGCLATLGAGVWENSMATITIEDSGAFRIIGDKIIEDPKQQIFNYLLTEKHIITGGPTSNGGVIFNWFAKQFGDFTEAFDIDQSMEMLIEEAAGVEVGSGGLIFLPFLHGERAPIWNPNSRGCYFGVNIRHERKHFIRATIEGILYEMYSIGRTLEPHRHIETLSINGSFASIPFCAQIIADLFNKPVSTISHADSIGKGAFLLSATEMGIYPSLEEASKTVTMHQTYLPNAENHQVYAQYFKVFESLITKVADEFDAISDLQQRYSQ
ncbi:gluconokinase [Mucilaginibacter gossypii]|uniref:gluconokinase n=1 Tax=Mucilaginibacter gossypii TaxID=551996 RepID=UPI000DCE18E7|nr:MULTISPECIES: gluconokinase [Mucilaginibacter]QTE38936.1 gluconokinase [Mucilaginibacter gossypii]RAV53563.1 gluconokinase [Mucilaginibacter rubeus]